MNKIIKPLEYFIFWSRWLQAPLYLGLIVAQGVYVYQFMIELAHLVTKAGSLTENEVLLIVLGLIDVVMIANLLTMVVIGGYETFVSRLELEGNPDQPEWLSHVNAGVLKIKLSTAIIGISSIHLLKSFINALSCSACLWRPGNRQTALDSSAVHVPECLGLRPAPSNSRRRADDRAVARRS